MGIFWKMCHQITLITLLTSTLHLKLAHYWKIWKLIQIYSTTTSLVYIWIEYYNNVGGGGIRFDYLFYKQTSGIHGFILLGMDKKCLAILVAHEFHVRVSISDTGVFKCNLSRSKSINISKKGWRQKVVLTSIPCLAPFSLPATPRGQPHPNRGVLLGRGSNQ